MTATKPEYLDIEERVYRNEAEGHLHNMNAQAFQDDLSTQEVAEEYNRWSDTYDSVSISEKHILLHRLDNGCKTLLQHLF